MRSLSLLDPAYLSRAVQIPMTGLELWLKADSLVLSNNDPVTTWTDSSLAGHNFTQATALNKPTYKTSQQNGLPGVSFDGSSDFLTGTLTSGITSYSWFAVLKFAATSGTPVVFVHGNPIAGNYLYVLNGGNREVQHRTSLGAPTDMIDAAATTNTEVVSIVTTSAPLAKLRINAVDKTITPNNGAFNGVDTTGTIGRFSAALGLYFNGLLFEVLAYTSNLSDADRNSVENYLNTKYSVF